MRNKRCLPTVPTVSIDPESNTCFSTANANSAAASPASFLLQIIYTRTSKCGSKYFKRPITEKEQEKWSKEWKRTRETLIKTWYLQVYKAKSSPTSICWRSDIFYVSHFKPVIILFHKNGMAPWAVSNPSMKLLSILHSSKYAKKVLQPFDLSHTKANKTQILRQIKLKFEQGLEILFLKTLIYFTQNLTWYEFG